TASTVRKFVDEDLGVDRVAKAKETKRLREEEDRRRQEASEPEGHRYLMNLAMTIDAEARRIRQDVDQDAWGHIAREHGGVIYALRNACASLLDALPGKKGLPGKEGDS